MTALAIKTDRQDRKVYKAAGVDANQRTSGA
jgi:hypothetical protein